MTVNCSLVPPANLPPFPMYLGGLRTTPLSRITALSNVSMQSYWNVVCGCWSVCSLLYYDTAFTVCQIRLASWGSAHRVTSYCPVPVWSHSDSARSSSLPQSFRSSIYDLKIFSDWETKRSRGGKLHPWLSGDLKSSSNLRKKPLVIF